MARILVIDDDDGVRSLVSEELSHEGHAVSVAADGWAGLRAVAAAPPDLVLLDLKMPGLGGLDVLQRLKAAHPTLPVLLFTAYSDFTQEAASRGADGYLVKSADFGAVKRAIRALTP